MRLLRRSGAVAAVTFTAGAAVRAVRGGTPLTVGHAR